jgi:CelD/BcsL family acetyltransferase involved in cellulose biosynthesis
MSSASASLSRANLAVRIENSFQGLDSLRAAWDEAALRLGGTIYMSYDWCKAWWHFYGDHKELRLFLFYAEERIVGIVPIYVDCVGIKWLGLKVARLVGSNIPPKVFDPPIEEKWAGPIFRQVLTQLFECDFCDLLSFGPVSAQHKPAQILEAVARGEARGFGRIYDVSGGVHSVFFLPGTYEEYLAALSRNERKKHKQDLAQLGKEYLVEMDVISDPVAVEIEFGRFALLHKMQWEGDGRLGHFGSWPKGEEFNQMLVKTQGKLGRVRFIRILAGGRVVSSIYGFAFGNHYFAELPARAVGPEWHRFSLGQAGLLAMIRAAIDEEMSLVEGGIAHYEHKLRLNAKEFSIRVVRVVSGRLASFLRRQVYGFLQFCLLWGYYKLWYKRISPRLPAVFRKPIWSFWLRLDF